MNKTEFIKVLAEKTGATLKQTGEFVDKFWETIEEATIEHGEVKFVGKGTFTKVEKPERDGHNPKTMEAIKIEASTGIKFRPGKDFKKIK